jgi:DNA-binding MarR family transcriptional regulator/GNAT superfamily N-acetyltransferase
MAMDPKHIETVRTFNRAITLRLGVLSDRFLGSGRPLSQARVLYEIGSRGVQVRDLRSRLCLESGYLSRLLRSLERQGLAKRCGTKDGARGMTISLTGKGMHELKELDRLSHQFASLLLQRLPQNQQEILVQAMSAVERLMQAAAVKVAVVSPRCTAARWCLGEYFQELARRFTSGFDPARSIPADPKELTPPAGYFLLASLDGGAVGCGALKVKTGGIGEIKRMWVSPSARGMGIAQRILSALEACARDAGVDVLRLETNETLKEAQSLYRRSGYQEVPAFNEEPYAHRWFEKMVSPPRSSINSQKRISRE